MLALAKPAESTPGRPRRKAADVNPSKPVHDPDVERALLGAMLLSRDAIAAAMEICGSEDFYQPAHAHIFEAVAFLYGRGEPVEPIIVAAELDRIGTPVPLTELTGMLVDAPMSSTARKLAEIVASFAVRRRADAIGHDLRRAAAEGDIDGGMVDALGRLEALRRGAVGVRESPTLAAFLDQDFTTGAQVIPGLLERGDRAILTGLEGMGKSTVLRQVGILPAAGLHPFTFDAIPPVRSLIVDAENPPALVQRKMADIRRLLGADSPADENLRVEIGADYDLLDARSAAQFEALVDRSGPPDLLVIGPSYKLAGGDPTEEATARAVVAVLDRIRARHGCAIILEAHTPHGAEERPYGASLWKRWPEFGVFLAADGRLRHWRGQRDQRDWPVALRRGGAFPWEPVEVERDVTTWSGPTHCSAAVLAVLEADPDDEISVNQLLARLKARGKSYRKETVSVAAEGLVDTGRAAVRNGPNRSRLFRLKVNP